jgi:hypothetical protein
VWDRQAAEQALAENVKRIACFVSPHGFGHAARASAVIRALQKRVPRLHADIFTTVNESFFHASLAEGRYACHRCLTDIGLVQKSSIHEDLPATVERLNSFFPLRDDGLAELAAQVAGASFALCDISPLGIRVARLAGVPSVLVENFTWHWIYGGYAPVSADLNRHAVYLQGLFESADVHIQTEPVCEPGAADLTTGPVSRELRSERTAMRRHSGIPQEAKAVLLTMGGVSDDYAFLDTLAAQRHILFVIPTSVSAIRRQHNLLLVPHGAGLYHPDLVNACDGVVGKLGYSTIAEVYQAGVPFGYITRPCFREAEILAAFVDREIPSVRISHDEFFDGRWISSLPALLALVRVERRGAGGADQIADYLLQRFALRP